MKTLLRLFIFCLFSVNLVKGQDIQMTQFYAMPTYLNPAFAGANVCSRVSLMYRDQWRGLDAYRSKMVGIDHAIGKSNWGIGLLVGQDEAGAGLLKSSMINPAVSYEAHFNRVTSLRLALQPGIGMRSISYDHLTFGDQLYRGGNVATVESVPGSRTFFDLGAGAILSHKIYWAGISLAHLNRPNESLAGHSDSRLPVRFSFHGGAKLDLNREEKDPRYKQFLSPVIHYRAQGKFDQVDAGFYYNKGFFTLGLWYRGLPLIKSYKPGYQNNDALALLAGIQLTKMRVGYSYDNTISNLTGISKGAHEITLSFELCTIKHKKRKMLLISCPKF